MTMDKLNLACTCMPALCNSWMSVSELVYLVSLLNHGNSQGLMSDGPGAGQWDEGWKGHRLEYIGFQTRDTVFYSCTARPSAPCSIPEWSKFMPVVPPSILTRIDWRPLSTWSIGLLLLRNYYHILFIKFHIVLSHSEQCVELLVWKGYYLKWKKG